MSRPRLVHPLTPSPPPLLHSGPLSREGYIGFFGTIFHVTAWLLALIFDIIIVNHIDQDNSPGAFTYWLFGFITLMIGFVVLVVTTLLHAATDKYKIPEGGAPPFIMTLFITGAQVSLVLTLLAMIASTSGTNNDYFYINGSLTAAEQEDERNAQRGLMVISMMSKMYINGFLKNNQECKCYAQPQNTIAPMYSLYSLYSPFSCRVLQGPVPRTSSRSRSRSSRRRPKRAPEKHGPRTPPPCARCRLKERRARVRDDGVRAGATGRGWEENVGTMEQSEQR